MEPKLEVTMDEYLPLRDVVFKTLRQAILRGELKPGVSASARFSAMARSASWSWKVSC